MQSKLLTKVIKIARLLIYQIYLFTSFYIIMKKRVRAKFLPHEDRQLKALVAEFGEDQWRKVASRMPNRNVRQCRERWKHYICSDSSKIPWNKQEDEILLKMVNEYGFKWTKIAKCLPGRTDIQVKSRWYQVFDECSESNLKRERCTDNTPKSTENCLNDTTKPKNQNEIMNLCTFSESAESEISSFCDQIDFRFGDIKNTFTFSISSIDYLHL